MKKDYTIIAIDTSCDETSVAITQDTKLIANVISSQVELHKKWGGVVPDIAKRAHQEHINEAVQEALKRARMTMSDIDAVAVTQGPGLAIALEVGIKKAKELAITHNKPLLAVNHMEGHLLSSLVLNSKGNGNLDFSLLSSINNSKMLKHKFPLLGLLVSGGHTELILIKQIGSYQKIGQTVDDAAGEAFDKFAKMLDLGYPGGELVEKLAQKGDPTKYDLPRPMSKSGDLNYSFSGLKTAVLYLIRDLKKEQGVEQLPKEVVYDLSASFQEAVIDSLMIKFKRALKKYEPQAVLCGGGVMANLSLRKAIRKEVKGAGIPIYFPFNKKLYTDNAGMIGLTAFYMALQSKFWKESLELVDRKPGLSL